MKKKKKRNFENRKGTFSLISEMDIARDRLGFIDSPVALAVELGRSLLLFSEGR